MDNRGDASALNSSSQNKLLSQSIDSDEEYTDDPADILNKIKVKHLTRLICGQLNINSIRNKFDLLKMQIKGNIDILVITESKLDRSFPSQLFFFEGYAMPYQIDRNASGGGVLIYIREDIPCRDLAKYYFSNNKPNIFEGIFLEINLRKTKWLLFGGYNPVKINIDSLQTLSSILDKHLPKYDNIILLGDFNAEIVDSSMQQFCETYHRTNLIKDPTCFKNPLNPSSIDLILTNRPKSFIGNTVIETGLSDHHKMTITVLKTSLPKQTPNIIRYRDYRNVSLIQFRNELFANLNNMNEKDTNMKDLNQFL